MEYNYGFEHENEEPYACVSSECEVSSTYAYHYTSKSKAKSIIQSGLLYPSTNEYNDCLFGIGVYFTSLTPSNSKRDILYNNYGNETRYNESNANAWVRIPLHNLDFKQIRCDRNVWIYRTTDALDLSTVEAEVSCLTCDFGSDSRVCTPCEGRGTAHQDCYTCNASGRYQPYSRCRTCYGNGTGRFICPECVGGMVQDICDECDSDGEDYYGDECEECDGVKQIEVQCGNCSGDYDREDCPSCNATGNYFAWKPTQQCNKCNGSGTMDVECNECEGSGQESCPECDGHDVIYLN